MLLLLTSISAAADRAGRYSATELIARWNVGDWGETCGPRPSGGSEPPATFQVESNGPELTFVGPRTYRTTGCWEQMPGLRATSHSATDSAIRTVCTMPPGDPREATVTTNWTLRADKLYLDEVGQYRFLLGGQACTASVRRTRVWTKLPDGSPPAPSTTPPASPRSPPPEEPRTPPQPAPSDAGTDACDLPGPVARLATRGAAKIVIAGQTIPLDVAPLDARGCPLDAQVRYEVRSGAALVAKLARGALTVAESAPPGKIVLEARFERLSVELVVKVVSRDEYSALLEGGSSLPAVSTVDGTVDRRTNVTVESAASEPSATGPLSKIGAVALGVGTLGTAAYFFLRRRKRPAAVEPKAFAETPAKICPVCGRRYENEAMFCGDDGALLQRAN